VEQKWTLPEELPEFEVAENEGSLYCLILRESHIALVNGYECVTWGHSFEDEKVKDYFGVNHPIV
jgi:hypothetical protein